MKNKNFWLYGIIKRVKNKNFLLYGITIGFTLLFVASAVIFKIYQIEILPSQFYGALIGVVITAIITGFLLQGQTDQGMKRDKDVRIFEQKIRVYSEFTERMWAMFDDGKVTDEELKELRAICFRRLVFYLDSTQIEKITEQIDSIRDTSMKAAGAITHILQRSLNTDENEKTGDLIKLFNSFDKKDSTEKEELKQVTTTESSIQQDQQTTDNITYWHFNILYEQEQIEAFKRGNWVLALIEYGEDWRTGLIKQVKPDDVIFLFKRGGAGYIGVFRAKNPSVKILEGGKPYSDKEKEEFDIYEGLDDGASLCSNLLVEPIAYNFKGVGYYSVRRRTIERMNGVESVKYLLNRFNGKDLDEDNLAGKGKLDNDTTLTLNEKYFSEIVSINNL